MTNHIHLLTDGDIVAYRASCSKDQDGNLLTLDGAIANIESHFRWLRDTLGADQQTVLLSDRLNYRKVLYPPYKANREGVERPSMLTPLKDYLKEEHGAFALDWLEADDTMGIMQTEPTDETRIMVSIDKDMKQIPGLLFNPGKWQEGVKTITEEDADAWFYMQLLTGDSTDNIPGCPTIGEKRAGKILEDKSPDEWWAACEATFERHQLDLTYALTQARMVRLLRHNDYDIASGIVSLWLPDGGRELRRFTEV